MTNLTLTGYGEADGIKLREGTMENISNVIIDNFSDGLDVEHAITVSNLAGGELVLSNISISNVGDIFEIKGFDTVADSTSAADKINAAVGDGASGAGTNWRSGWSKSL